MFSIGNLGLPSVLGDSGGPIGEVVGVALDSAVRLAILRASFWREGGQGRHLHLPLAGSLVEPVVVGAGHPEGAVGAGAAEAIVLQLGVDLRRSLGLPLGHLPERHVVDKAGVLEVEQSKGPVQLLPVSIAPFDGLDLLHFY